MIDVALPGKTTEIHPMGSSGLLTSTCIPKVTIICRYICLKFALYLCFGVCKPKKMVPGRQFLMFGNARYETNPEMSKIYIPRGID